MFFLLMPVAGVAYAQNNITALNVAGIDNGKTVIKVELAQPLANLPPGFTTDAPPRIVLDFLDTTNGLGKSVQDFTVGGARSANIVQAGGRTRLVINLERMLAYNTSIDGNNLLLALQDEAAAAPAIEEEPVELRFDISGYTLEGASLLTQAEIDAAVAPFIGKNKDFSDVQRALEAVEDAYAKRGFSAVRVGLPEQELEKGAVRFRVVESRFDKVAVKDNRFVSEANALNAVPSVRSGGVPQSRRIARELKLANENPARQMNVVLKPGVEDGLVDANIIVTDSDPVAWGLMADNSGTPETGRSRFGLSWRHANLFDADHVAGLQFQTSPEHVDRVAVLGGSYKIPLYQSGDSLEFFGGYSNVNSVVGGLAGAPSNFQGGGLMLSARYSHPLEKTGTFDRRLSFGLDWRNFRRIEQTTPQETVLYNEIVVVPLTLAYAAQGRFARSDLNLDASLSANLPGLGKGKTADFAAYDQVNFAVPDANYRVVRYGASYSALVFDDWQFRAVLNGQWSNDTLIQGEQMRLGGANAVRGFSEGSVGGEKGTRWNLEGYTPDFGSGDFRARGLVFFDAGETRSANGVRSSISGAGIGLRAGFAEQFSLRFDAARIINADTDPTQQEGDWRAHIGLSASF
ncbi:MAG: hypothetical protein A3F73_03965 [Gallionellales bacterium RIFCSPLOWO2_12_FULL_59_22]|nr:MAG: hypothetical protein A3H99_07845 [Gallionellales bacterium RIFCSPLOWO2_02_FULL_59_110]OGT05171.1 MAG: hypothetical protein A2Z65_07560 [Gallionellales bacterium RIFCSPLOWO2_02_58_13]OGT13610.1 MAG: hypothetical protein A3F73_03965 [Gallionellales bacterium RIFCSPLOWO2_12_FULL_59_22]